MAYRMMMAAVLAVLVLSGCRSRTDRADAYESVYDQQMGANSYGAALAAIRKAVNQDENEPRRWLKLAKLQDLMGRPAAAANAYQRALDLQPYNIEALENLAVLSVRGGQYQLAKRFIDPLLLLEPNDLAGLLASGAVALFEKRFADADKIAATIIAGAPDREEGYILRARVFEETGRPAAAAALLEQRMAIDSNNRDLPLELMTMYRRQGARDGIRRTAIRLMEIFPDDPRYALESVRAYHAMNRDDEARRIIATLTKRYSGSVPIMAAIGGLWRDIATPAEATDQIAGIAARSPGRVKTALADILTTMGAPARAAAVLAPIAAGPVSVDNIDAQAAYARAIYGQGRTAEAERKITEILGLDQTNPVALLIRARLAYSRGDYPKAATDAGVVASDDDANEEAALLLGAIYSAQGNPLLAAKAFGDARIKFPDSARVLRTQTQWLISQKRAGEAVTIAASYVHAPPRRVEGWQIYRDICAEAGNTTCLATARRALTSFAS